MPRTKSPSKTPAKTASKTARPPAAGLASTPEVSADERQHMIAEAAYYRALQRGFQGGDSIEDWLAAEREVNRLLPSARQQKQELEAYRKLRTAIGAVLGEARDSLSAETIREAFDKGRAQMRVLGEHTVETVDKVAASVEKDMIAAAQRLGTTLDGFSHKTADVFGVWRDRGQQFASQALRALGEWQREMAARATAHTYRSGEMAAAGELTCQRCGEHVTLTTAAHVPLCPKCRHSEFTRS
jgi:hypothetical protein